jgi:hypothetical protein
MRMNDSKLAINSIFIIKANFGFVKKVGTALLPILYARPKIKNIVSRSGGPKYNPIRATISA